MIVVHRLAHGDEELWVNPDLLVTVEAHPDTVLTLATGARLIVAETPEQIAGAVRAWRAGVRAAAQEEIRARRPLKIAPPAPMT